MSTEAISIVGPGRMGIGIATAVLQAGQGVRVRLVDTKKRPAGSAKQALERARAEIIANLELLHDLGMVAGDVQSCVQDLSLSSRLAQGVCGCAIVFEALPERVDVKQRFFKTVGPLVGKETVIASATSTFHLDLFWEACTRPGNVVCAHWLNPAFLVPLVELASGEKTHDWAVDHIFYFLSSIGKIPVKMATTPGFIVPRIQAAAMNEAVRIIEEGAATAESVDTAVKAGFGFRLGVLGLIEFVDLGGVDILYHAGRYLHAKLGGEHFNPPASVAKKMHTGQVGPRAGRGYYNYQGVDVRELFNEKYRGFVELLRLYKQSEHLNFIGGITTGKSSKHDLTPKH